MVIYHHAHFPAIKATLLATLTLLLIVSLIWAKQKTEREEAFFRSVHSVSVDMGNSFPKVNQESIDIAMVAFGIKLPSGANYPLFDPELLDRGLTAKGVFSRETLITIGEAAYYNWGLLASTLAHEAEVHGRQNILAITFLDLIGLDGTGLAEREAYEYEVKHARRFGLSVKQADLISDTMNFYYPKTASVHVVNRLKNIELFKRWFARHIIYQQP